MPAGIFKSHKIRALLLYPLYWISKLTRRSADIWLFAPMNHAFLDNAKYLFLHVTQHHPEIKAFFVSEKAELIQYLKEQNLPVLDKWSLKAFYYGLIAKFYLISAYVDDINFWTSGGAVVFNLWHGIPLKKIEFDISTGLLAKRYQKRSWYNRIFKPYFYRRPDFVLSTSQEVSRLFASAFRVSPTQCPPLGYPRTDIFFKSKEEIKKHIQQYESKALNALLKQIAAYERVILYMPTWRDDRQNFMQKAFPNVEQLNDALKLKNALLLIKLHPNDSSLKTFRDLSHIKTMPAKIDLYPFLPFTDGLITDYSSIYFDYMLLKKPIIFYPFDLEEYLRNREMYFDYQETLPGPVVGDFGALLEVVASIESLTINEKYEQLLNRFWLYRDGKSCERVTEFLKNL
ncbi:CDP-glycerol glycerophosphotransferase family protein [Caldithrix abyssi]